MLGSQANLIAFVSLTLWFMTMVSFAPSAWRYIKGPYNLLDSYRTAIFFMAMLWCGGLGRLVLIPQAEGVRLAVLAMSCALAIYLMILAFTGAKR